MKIKNETQPIRNTAYQRRRVFPGQQRQDIPVRFEGL